MGLEPKLDKAISGYLPPEQGPFQCQHCIYFHSGECEVVDGDIDPEGCCNLYVPKMMQEEEENGEG